MRLFLYILLGTLVACSHKSKEQCYLDFIKDPKNMVVQQIKIGDMVATLKWLPAEYNRMMKKARQFDTSSMAHEDYYYFNLKLDKMLGNKPEKEKALYLEFDIQNDFFMVPGKDSVLPVICQRIQNGMSGSYEYMLVFEKDPNRRESEGFAVVYNDKIFGIGSIAFVFKGEDIQKIPKLTAKES